MSKHQLQKVLEHAGVEGIRSYSGRAMYGRICLGVDTDDVGEVFAAILESVEGEEDTRDIQEAFRNMRTDSMGRGTIVYFPQVPFVDDEEDEEEEDDEDPPHGEAELPSAGSDF